MAALQDRVERAAEAALRRGEQVCAVVVLCELGWLAQVHVDHWRQGRADHLEQMLQVRPDKLATALRVFGAWVARRGLVGRDVAYLARTRDHRPLRFTAAGTDEAERLYRTHWVVPQMPTARRERLVAQQGKAPDLVVVDAIRDWTCVGCSDIGDLLLMQDDGPLCLRCARLDHLVFLPAGDAGRTRRAHKASSLTAVVVRFSRSRKRYERQGLLVEPGALAEADAGSRSPPA